MFSHEFKFRKRASTCKQRPSTGVLIGILKSTFRIRRRVGKWEYDRCVVPPSHLGEDLCRENAADGRQAHEYRGLYKFHYFRKALVLLAIIIIPGEVDLMVCQLVAAIIGD